MMALLKSRIAAACIYKIIDRVWFIMNIYESWERRERDLNYTQFIQQMSFQKTLHDDSRSVEEITPEKLKGDIKFDNVHFTYSSRDTPILNVRCYSFLFHSKQRFGFL